jgi:dihydrofolate reductase
MMTTLDGYFEGVDGDLGWHNVDDEFNEFSVRQLDEADTLVFGRVTYQTMAGFWPTPAVEEANPALAARMNGMAKVVVSRTLDMAGWANTRLVKNDVVEELTKLKREPGKDIGVLGSSDLTVSLLGMGLVDELRIMVNPVVLGAGTPLFATANGRIHLDLLKTRGFASGNVLHHYRPAA